MIAEDIYNDHNKIMLFTVWLNILRVVKLVLITVNLTMFTAVIWYIYCKYSSYAYLHYFRHKNENNF